MFVKYSPKVPHIKIIPLLSVGKGKDGKGYTFDNDTVTLRPGTNEVTEQEWEAIQPHIKELLGKEIVPFTVEVKSGKGGKGKKAKTLKDVPIITARKIIQGCTDPATLKKWFDQELPDELLLVVTKRMRQLKIEPNDLETDEDALDLKGDDITPEENLEKKPESDEDSSGLDEDEEEIPDFDGSRSK
jgi:hypothetical protein